MINPTDIDRIDADIRARYPYPLAATFYRAFYDAPDLSTIHEYLLDLFEVTLKYCAAIVLAQYVKDGIDDPVINRSLQDLQRPSLGHWQGWLREILRLYVKQRRALLVPELVSIYTAKNTTEIYRAATALRELMSQQMDYRGEGGNPSSITTQQFFELLGSYRNKLAHGARLNSYTKERVANILMPAMRELFVLLAPLADYRLVYISEVKLAVGPVRRGPRHYDHVFTYLVGDRPRVSRVPKTLSEEETVDPKQLYLLAKKEEFQPILSLHPFLIFQYCDRCSNEQAYVLNMSRENDLTYLSYQCAHQFSVTGLLNDLLLVINPADGARPFAESPAADDPAFDRGPLLPPDPVVPPPPATPAYPYSTATPSGPGLLPPPPAAAPAMVICPVCRHANAPERKFCGGCGTRLQAVAAPPPVAPPRPVAPPPAATVTCPRCGQTYPVGRRFCGGCGFALAGVPPRPSAPGPLISGPGPLGGPSVSLPTPTVPLTAVPPALVGVPPVSSPPAAPPETPREQPRIPSPAAEESPDHSPGGSRNPRRAPGSRGDSRQPFGGSRDAAPTHPGSGAALRPGVAGQGGAKSPARRKRAGPQPQQRNAPGVTPPAGSNATAPPGLSRRGCCNIADRNH